MPAASGQGLTRRKTVWAIGLAIAVGVFALFFGKAIVNARDAARVSQCRNNLKQISLALQNYHDTYNCFPPAITYGPDGKPWHSWRVLIHTFLLASDFYDQYQFDEPWDGPNNRKLMASPPWYDAPYRCPSDDSNAHHTSYLAVIGDGTMWPADGVTTLDDADGRNHQIIHLVEVADSGIHWMEPRDLSFDAMTFALNGEGESVGSRHTEAGWLRDGRPRANAAFVDGHVGPITATTRPEQFRAMLLRDDPLDVKK